MSLTGVQNIILVLSGKGGVGKSSVTTQLALTLAQQGQRVGVLDLDLTGPSIPRMFQTEGASVKQSPSGWMPVAVEVPASSSSSGGSLGVMSLALLLRSRGDSVVWRGPKKTAMVRQFLADVAWGPRDFLLIDTPPGTSDEHIALAESLTPLPNLRGAVVVTTPQAVATADVRKELNFCKKTHIHVLGVVENMSGFVCPHCAGCTNVFGKGGGEVMAKEFGVGFLGSIPIDPAFVALIEAGTWPVYPGGTKAVGAEGIGRAERETAGLVEKYKACALFPVFESIVTSMVTAVEEGKNGHVEAETAS